MKRPCAVCGKECDEFQRNTDGTYLHDECAHATSTRPGLKPEKDSGSDKRTEPE